MIRILVFIIAIGLIAFGFAWLADQPGSLQLEWFGYQIQTSAFVAALAVLFVAALVVAIWGTIRYLLTRPGAIAAHMKERRRRHGFEALTNGLIAIGMGDRSKAEHHAHTARRLLPNEPLTALLKAQTAQLKQDSHAARRAFEAMLGNSKTELLGLRGLFLEAKRRNDPEAARAFAEQAVSRDPHLAWGVNALFDLQARAGDWEGALKTLETARQYDHIDSATATRRRAVLLTAEAREQEQTDPDKALHLALEAQRLAPSLIPAAEIAGRILADKGEGRRSARVVAKTWKLNPHPDLALVYTFSKHGESPKDRLKRAKYLASYRPDDIESPLAVATAAVEAKEWEEARMALAPYLDDHPSARICTLMARIEAGEFGDRGRERQWLARAVRAPRDRAWIADGYISDRWLPVSPLTGQVDAFAWKAPVDAIGRGDESLVIEEAPAPPPEAPAAPPAGTPEIMPKDTFKEALKDVSPEPRPEPEGETPKPAPEPVTIEAQPVVEPAPQPAASDTPQAPASSATSSTMPPAPEPRSDEPKSDGSALPPQATQITQASAPGIGSAAPGTSSSRAGPYHDAPYIPVRPPDDPGIGDDELDETSDLERLRSAQVR